MRAGLLAVLLVTACGGPGDPSLIAAANDHFGPAQVQNYAAPLSRAEIIGTWIFCGTSACDSDAGGLRFTDDGKIYTFTGQLQPPVAAGVGVANQKLTSGSGSGGFGASGALAIPGGLSRSCNFSGTFAFDRGNLSVTMNGQSAVIRMSRGASGMVVFSGERISTVTAKKVELNLSCSSAVPSFPAVNDVATGGL